MRVISSEIRDLPNICMLLALVLSACTGYALTGEEILDRMDRNRDYTTITYSGTMTIHIGDEVRTKAMVTKALNVKGDTKAIVEFTNPEDQGTKFLMLGKNLWIYFPDEEDVVKISGHLLKEGMMGSDVSYEDALESDKLREKYTITLEGEKQVGNRKCYNIVLDAKVADVPYFKRTMLVDKEYFIVWREQMFARSGKLLKESNTLDIDKIGGRWYPTRVEMVNKLRKDTKTVFAMTDLAFDASMDESMFTMRYLRR